MDNLKTIKNTITNLNNLIQNLELYSTQNPTFIYCESCFISKNPQPISRCEFHHYSYKIFNKIKLNKINHTTDSFEYFNYQNQFILNFDFNLKNPITSKNTNISFDTFDSNIPQNKFQLIQFLNSNNIYTKQQISNSQIDFLFYNQISNKLNLQHLQKLQNI